jgi:hypothetical protein
MDMTSFAAGFVSAVATGVLSNLLYERLLRPRHARREAAARIREVVVDVLARADDLRHRSPDWWREHALAGEQPLSEALGDRLYEAVAEFEQLALVRRLPSTGPRYLLRLARQWVQAYEEASGCWNRIGGLGRFDRVRVAPDEAAVVEFPSALAVLRGRTDTVSSFLEELEPKGSWRLPLDRRIIRARFERELAKGQQQE